MAITDEIQEISKEGFQVVSGQMFQRVLRLGQPTATIWPNSVSFSKAALQALNVCERIRIEVNAAKRCILIVPVTEKDPDNVRWLKSGKELTARKIECTAFTSQLYNSWGWKKDLAYRVTGRIVTAEKKVMLLFDFSAPENWKYKEKARAK